MIKEPKGTKDILPEEIPLWHFVENVLREKFEVYGYEEIRTPIFEHTDLFARGVGEGTDIVTKEMYTFEDKKGRSLTLRPEATASVMRAYLGAGMHIGKQVDKLYYMGPMFRYEKPQKGRYRQFHQFGAELLGTKHPASDAELIEMLVSVLDELGLKNIKVLLNSIGCKECRSDFVEALKSFARENREVLCSQCDTRYKKNPLRMLDCKEEKCKELFAKAPETLEFLCRECDEHFDRVRDYLNQMQVEYELDSRMVRGLDYYSRTTFELVHGDLGSQDAVVGGGRYDDLAGVLSDESVPGIGFAGGMERLTMLINDENLKRGVQVYVITLGDRAFKKGFEYLAEFRENDISSLIDFQDRSMKAQMKQANRSNARYAFIIGERELEKGLFQLKEMESGEQVEVDFEDAVERIKEGNSENSL